MKKITSFIKDKIQKITKFNYKQYAKTNILFFTTVLSLVINATVLRTMTVGNILEVKPILADLGIVLLLLAPAYLLKPKKQIRYLMTLSIFLTFICVINSVYFTYYSSFTSFSLLSTSLQVVDVADAVTKNVMQLRDFIYVWQPLLVIFVHISLKKKNYYYLVEKVEKGKKRLVATLAAGFVILSVFAMTLTDLEIGRLIKQWNREYIVMKFGIYAYQLNDAVTSLEPKINAVFGYDEVARKIKQYYDENPVQHTNNKYTDMFKGKNLLMIHAESMQQFLIGMKFNGQEVTPTLNKLSKEGMYFSNFYSQVGVGTSSDAEFTLTTSLMPATNGTVFVSYWDREYVALPKLMRDQGYYAFSMHGNKGDMWNRTVMHKQLGYQRFYDKADYTIDDVIGLGLSDKSFFRQSIPKIKTISEQHQNYYGTLIMLSNHTPFSDTDKYGEFPVTETVTKPNDLGVEEQVTVPYMEGTDLGNYFKSVHYADAALGEFIDGMDKEGLLDNTVIVIYGDHDARLPKNDYVRLYNYDPYTDTVKDETDPTYKPVDYYDYELNRKVPLIIWSKNDNKNIKQEVTKVTGMYDVLPTLGNMFGFSSPYALGHDIFSIDNNMVVFANGNWLTQDVYYNSQKQEFKLLNANAVITQDYIDKYDKIAGDKIDVSNGIIVYDYIRKSEESQKVLQNKK